ncbi:hypothetical protein [Treponema bryantii]|uniref:ABC transporter permease n=1 Tax=Treponema bryantii TaxID=163 RepID=UPI002B2C777C|nr:membrane protein [Treponema bryantii]
MNKYVKYIEMGYSDALYYRTSNILTFLSTFFTDYIKVAVWYSAVAFAANRLNPRMVNDTLLYMILSAALSAIYRTAPTTTLSDAYLNGSLIHRMIYPVSILFSNYCEMLGKAISRFVVNIIPTLLILSWDYRPIWNINLARLPIVLINIVIGLYFNFLIFSLIDVLCFWIKQTAVLQKFREIIFKFFSGALLPLWFFTGRLSVLSDYLPFSKMLYTPVSYLMGLTIKDVYFFELWILILYCIAGSFVLLLLWKKGIKRVESFGG